MPKIEVKEKALHRFAGISPSLEELIEILPAVKGEVDGSDPATGTLKLEFNDTNRPDLWSTAGAGRALKAYYKGEVKTYDFFSTPKNKKDDGGRKVQVNPKLKDFRPYIAAICVSGNVDEFTLEDIIQTQEKLCWNFGRKRKTFAMGVYRSSLIKFPVHYEAADPDKTKFIPLGMTQEMTLKEILKKHPKGVEFGHIVEKLSLYPLIVSNDKEILSFPPIINSNKLGAVEPGDKELFIEITGTDLPSIVLAMSIVACDLSDAGFKVKPVTVQYPYETVFGKEITFPYYFQEDVQAEVSYINKLLGEKLSPQDMVAALKKMGVDSQIIGDKLNITVPEYRNDFLHQADVGEDVMIGRGMNSFDPVRPSDATIGRLTDQELFSRRIRDLMIGLGFQEMIFNYLGSKKDFIDRMNITGQDVVQIMNPMTENYEFVRNSIAPCLLEAEAASAHGVYPHHVYEIGKVVHLDDSQNDGTMTSNSLGFLSANADEGFNQANSRVAALFYYMNKEYTVKETSDPRFISGRGADVFYQGKKCGVFGEVHPLVLQNWNITVPCTLGEFNLDALI